MKTLKKANQRNVLLNKDYYTEDEVKEMIINNEVWQFDGKEGCFSHNTENCMNKDLRIGIENSELKVICDEYGYYTNVLIKNGKEYFVEL